MKRCPTLTCLGLLTLLVPAIAQSKPLIGVLKTGSQAGHYLVWDGKPVLLIGDSVTQGWMECGTDFQQEKYIDGLAARGINLVMIWSYIGTNGAGQVQDPRIGYDAPEVWPWKGSPDSKSFDLTGLNQAYFDRLATFVAYAESKQVVVLITVHDGWTKDRFGRHPFSAALGNGPLSSKEQYVELFNPAAEMPATYNPSWNRRQRNQYFQERFCDKLISTLAPYSNVIYEMFNEGEWYDQSDRRDHEQHFLAFFRARRPNLLLTNTDHITGDGPHGDSKVDVISLHGAWVNRFGDFSSGYGAAPAKPYLLSEPVPDWSGGNVSLSDVQRSMWEVALAGAGWVNQNDLSFGWAPKSKSAAQAALRDQAYDRAGHCARFFNNSGVSFSELSPAASLCSTGLCMAKNGVEYVVYAPGGGKFTVNLAAASGKPFAARFYDPQLGTFGSWTVVQGGGAAQAFSAPFAGAAVLHLRQGAIPSPDAGVDLPKTVDAGPARDQAAEAPTTTGDGPKREAGPTGDAAKGDAPAKGDVAAKNDGPAIEPAAESGCSCQAGAPGAGSSAILLLLLAGTLRGARARGSRPPPRSATSSTRSA